MKILLQDLRFGLRMLRRNALFTTVALATLGVGIGANTAIFSLVNAVLLQELPYRDTGRLVWVWATRTDRDKAFYSIPNFLDTRERARSFDQLAAFANWGVNLTGEGEPERLQGVRLSAHAFQMLGVEAAAGRVLTPADDDPGKAAVVMLSHGLWQRRFGGSREVVGRTLTLGGDPYTVAGVLPPSFTIPNAQIEVATALRLGADPRRTERGSNFLRVFGRLKRGVTVEQARAEMAAVTARLRGEYPDNAKLTAPTVQPLHEELVGGYRAALWLLLGAVGLALLIACANLANLLLARATGRRKEFTVRVALGATRFRLARQMLTECLLLALAGGALGAVLASFARDLLLALGPADLPRAGEVVMDSRILLFSLGLTLLVGIISGLAPALRAAGSDINDELKAVGRGAGDPPSRLRDALIVAEVAITLTLLVGAGLLVRSFVRLQSLDPGFEPRGLLTAQLSLPASGYGDAQAVQVFYEKLTARLTQVQGVEAVAAASVLPLSGLNARTDFTISGRPPATPADTPAAQDRWVSPGYFHAMRIPLVAGRDFTADDVERGAGVAVIDETLARRHWPDGSPLGAHLLLDYGTGEAPRDFEIVGVAGNIKHVSLNEEPLPTFYGLLAQIPGSVVTSRAASISIIARGAADTQAFTRRLRQELLTVDSQVAASSIRTMSQSVASTVAARRFNMLLMSVFAGGALLLAAGGLYAVLSYSVSQRTQEIGIRMALGAGAGDLVRWVLGRGLKLAMAGIAVGLVAALALTRLISSLLYGVSPTDPLTFAGVAALLMATALIACFVPARRATRVDPMVALRRE